jgi:hypothetical protein
MRGSSPRKVGGESMFKRPSPRFSCGSNSTQSDIRIMLALMSPNPPESESLAVKRFLLAFIVRFNWSA